MKRVIFMEYEHGLHAVFDIDNKDDMECLYKDLSHNHSKGSEAKVYACKMKNIDYEAACRTGEAMAWWKKY